MNPTAEQIELGKEILEGLIQHLGSIEHTIYLDQLEDRQILSVAAENHSLLIGRHGETLQAIQTIFNSLLKTRDQTAPYITIDIANYKKDRMEKIMRLAEDAARRVTDYGKPYELRPMNPFERRIVHMVLADKPELETESVGQEPNRKVIVKPAAS